MKNAIVISFIVSLTTFSVQSQNRIVLLEQFTNAGCPSCAGASPALYSFVNANPNDVVAIAYHTSWPYSDSMYAENPTETNARVAFYNVSSVPYTIVDGNVYSNNTANFNSSNSTIVNNRKIVAPKYSIQNNGLTLSGNQLSGTFQFNSINASNSSDNLVAHLVVIEKNVLKSAYAASPGGNSETQYGYVMRKMLPSSSGTTLVNKNMGANDIVSFNWTKSHIKNVNELRVVAFVQNTATKEIYQSQIFTPSIITSLETTNNEINHVVVYPNPASNLISIKLTNTEFISSVSITNQLGEVVYENNINAVINYLNTPLNLANGLYVLNISTPRNSIAQKIKILN